MLSSCVCNCLSIGNCLGIVKGTAQSQGARIKAQMSQLGIRLCPAAPPLQLESWGLRLDLGSVCAEGGQSSAGAAFP